MQEILLDENGYKQFCDEIERLKEQSDNNAISGSEAYEAAVGDGWHDNFAFEQSMRESRQLAKRIDDLMAKKKSIKIIEDKNIKEDLVNIGDVVKLRIKGENIDEEENIKLTGNYIPSINDDIEEITLNSPMGKVLYKAKIGDKVTYSIEDRIFEVTIISKENRG